MLFINIRARARGKLPIVDLIYGSSMDFALKSALDSSNGDSEQCASEVGAFRSLREYWKAQLSLLDPESPMT